MALRAFADTPVDAEDGADAHVHVDVAAAVQRIHGHHVLAAVVEVDDVVVLFAGHGAHHALAAQQADEEVVGVHVQLLLLFALDVLRALRADDVLGQSGLVHLAVHHLARQAEAGEQLAQLAGGVGEFVLAFSDELGEGLDDWPCDGKIGCSGDRRMTPAYRCGAKMRRACAVDRSVGPFFAGMDVIDPQGARPRMCRSMLELVQELAVFERAPDEVTVTQEHMRDAGFGRDPVWVGWVAEVGRIDRGHGRVLRALFHLEGPSPVPGGYHCDRAMPGDNGSGNSLFRQCAAYAVEKDYTGMLWQVLDWNTDAIRFYERFGAAMDPQWVNGSLGSGTVEKDRQVMKVFKFGGASVKDAAGVRNVARVLKHFAGEEVRRSW